MKLSNEKPKPKKRRKRKSGRRKKNKVNKTRLKRIYHILLVNHGKQLRDLYWTYSEQIIYKKLHELLDEAKKVVFPVNWNNEKHVMVRSEYELVIIKQREFDENPVTKIKNDYGEFINYESSNDKWIIYDRAPYPIEESFWVYGYHPKLQRKSFMWIFETFIEKEAKDKYMFKSVQVYLNKVLIECNGKLEMVICKTRQDAIRMYNMIEELCKKKKYKYVGFMGDASNGKYVKYWVERIHELTNWPRLKISRSSTRP